MSNSGVIDETSIMSEANLGHGLDARSAVTIKALTDSDSPNQQPSSSNYKQSLTQPKQESDQDYTVSLTTHEPAAWRTPSFEASIHKKRKRKHEKSSIVFEDEDVPDRERNGTTKSSVPLKPQSSKSFPVTGTARQSALNEGDGYISPKASKNSVEWSPSISEVTALREEFSKRRKLSLVRQAKGSEHMLQTWEV
jgi:hypothetical protein